MTRCDELYYASKTLREFLAFQDTLQPCNNFIGGLRHRFKDPRRPNERHDLSEKVEVARYTGPWRWITGGRRFCSDHRGPQAPTGDICGNYYGRERLETTQEGRGFFHWVRIDLTAGIELYWGGKVWPGSSHSLDLRTVVAVDQQRKL